MSSTSNIQNLLVNVFRPTVSYDSCLGYVPKLNICNVDSISAKSLTVTTFGLGDSNGNIFIGSNSGGTSSNTNNTVVGYSAGSGMANTTSCVYIGNTTGIGAQGASNVIGIGKETRGAGTSNIYIGSSTGSSNASSSNNILIGHGLDYSNQVISNTLQIGRPGSLVIQGDLANKRVGINTVPSYGLDVCGSFSFHDSNGNFTYALDGSGNTQIDFRSSNAGKKAIMNIVGDVYAQTFYGDLSGGITTSSIDMGNGSITNPSYSFKNDASTGFFYSGTPATLGITTRSCNSMFITTTGVGIGTSNPSTTLDVSGILTVPAIINGSYIRNALTPTTWDISGGNISNSATTTSSNFTTSVTTSSNFIGGILLSNSNIRYAGSISNYVSSTSNYIGGVTLSNSNVGAGNGLVNAPAYSFTDLSVGMFSPGANQIAFTSAGIRRMVISNFNVGIGTPTPSFVLDVSGGIRSTSNASNTIGGVILSNFDIIAGNPANSTIYSVVEMGGGYNGDTTANTRSVPALSFQYGDITTGGYRHFIRSRHDVAAGSSGNAIDFFTNESASSTASTGPGTGNKLVMSVTGAGVGIGTSNPSTVLDVSGVTTIRGSNNTLVFQKGNYSSPANGTDGTTYGMIFNSSNFSDQARVLALDSTTAGGSWKGELALYTNQNSVGTATEKVRIDGFGLVGIGTTKPNYRLDVSASGSAARITDTLLLTTNQTTTSPGMRFRTSTTTQYFQWGPNVSNGVSDASGAKLIFSGINLSGTYMTIDQTNSNVGIGTTGPAYRLDVSTAASNTSINMSTWSRTAMSNTYCGTGTTRSGDAVIFSTTNTSIDSNVVTVASNTGTYFTINKNGVYAITTYVEGTAGGTFDSWIDASTSITHSGASAGTTIIAGKKGFTGETRYTLNYTGYLASNSGMYYKVKASNNTGLTSARLVITFLGETPAYSGFFV